MMIVFVKLTKGIGHKFYQLSETFTQYSGVSNNSLPYYM